MNTLILMVSTKEWLYENADEIGLIVIAIALIENAYKLGTIKTKNAATVIRIYVSAFLNGICFACFLKQPPFKSIEELIILGNLLGVIKLEDENIFQQIWTILELYINKIYITREYVGILVTAGIAWIGVFILSGIVTEFKKNSNEEDVKESSGENSTSTNENIAPSKPENTAPPKPENTAPPKPKISLSITRDGYVQGVDAKGKKYFANPARKGETLSIDGEEIIAMAPDESFRIITLQDLFPNLF